MTPITSAAERLKWTCTCNKCAETKDRHCVVYRIYNSDDYAWVLSKIIRRSFRCQKINYADNIIAFGRCPTEREAMAECESRIAGIPLTAPVSQR